MERIVYRITLDTHKTGIQRTLQGFETADNMSRQISVNLVAGSDTYEIPLDHVTAMMYITTPDATEPSINECVIEDNTIVYDMLPITTEGITTMQVKLIETRTDGARSVLVSPKFAVEVTESGTDDGTAEESATFTALEKAVAQAVAVYDARLVRIEIDEQCMFRAFYADGSIYESDVLYELAYKAGYLMSQSYATGGTGIREGEDTDNAKYYSDLTRLLGISYATGESGIRYGEETDNARYFSQMSQTYLENSMEVNADCHEVLTEVLEKSVYTSFSVDFETGCLTYLSQNYVFTIDEEGNLLFEGQGEWTPPDATKEVLENLVTELTGTITELENRVKALEEA